MTSPDFSGQVFADFRRAGGLDDASPLDLENITLPQLEEIRQLKHPSAVNRRVLECVHLILACGSKPPATIPWQDVLRTVVPADFLRQIRCYSLDRLLSRPAIVDRVCREYFAGPDALHVPRVRRASQSVVALFGWTVVLLAEAVGRLPPHVGGTEARSNLGELATKRTLRQLLRGFALPTHAEGGGDTNNDNQGAADCSPDGSLAAPAYLSSTVLELDDPTHAVQEDELEELTQLKEDEPHESEGDETCSDVMSEGTQVDLCEWDLDGNPDRRFLEGEGSLVCFPSNKWAAFCNVLTKEPLRRGKRFFQLCVHLLGDEQWFGVTSSAAMAGTRVAGRDLHAWTYYSGRRRSGPGGHPGLHCNKQVAQRFEPLESGDVVGLVVDLDSRGLAFLRNGKLQGAYVLPKAARPLFLLIHMTSTGDSVELTDVPFSEVPAEAWEAMALSCGNIEF